jgi:carbon starvation protein
MHGAKFVWITGLPMSWLVAVTFTAAWQKIFSPVPAIGFLAQASKLEMGLEAALRAGSIAAADASATRTLIFNARLDAAICGLLLVLVAVILADSLRVWFGLLWGGRVAEVSETPFVVSHLSPEEL